MDGSGSPSSNQLAPKSLISPGTSLCPWDQRLSKWVTLRGSFAGLGIDYGDLTLGLITSLLPGNK
jgi:hypothetical protein